MTAPIQVNKPNKVVLACLDGRRLKGYVSNFSPMRDRCRLFPAENSPHDAGTDVELKSLKAIFFVRDFAGNREHHDAYDLTIRSHGRKIEVTFQDGEKIAGTTEGYNPQKLGFFLFPSDAESNNVRAFIINSSLQEVKFP